MSFDIVALRMRRCKTNPVSYAYLLLILLFLSLLQPISCADADLSPTTLEEHGIPLLSEQTPKDTIHPSGKNGQPEQNQYEPLFSHLGSSLFGKRAVPPEPLTNNQPAVVNINQGHVLQYKFASAQLQSSPTTEKPSVPSSMTKRSILSPGNNQPELRKREDSQIFITLSVCRQPVPSDGKSADPPPGLELFVSSSDACAPGPGSASSHQVQINTNQGLGTHTDSVSTDVCIAVSAPQASGYSGNYTFELAVSLDSYYTSYMDLESLFFMDSDIKAGMFTTVNLTDSSSDPANSAIEAWNAAPFSIFIHNQNDTQIQGLMSSYCGLAGNAQIKGNIGNPGDNGIEVGITTLGNSTASGDFRAKQQFYVPSLNASSSYYAVLGLPTNYSQTGSGPTGGGSVWKAINFTTKTEMNCQLIYNLSFCSDVAYAVPSNGSTSVADLSAQYDNYTQSLWQNFSYSLQQIPCDTEPDSQYSLAANCANCSAAYKQWLCAVTIPRCADLSSDLRYLLPRNVNQKFPDGRPAPPLNDTTAAKTLYLNSSRNAMIDEVIKPGPYKEVLPCGDLCFGLVQACPAALGFACPQPDQGLSYDHSYGYLGGNASYPFCNRPGAIWGVGAGTTSRPPLLAALLVTALVSAALASGTI